MPAKGAEFIKENFQNSQKVDKCIVKNDEPDFCLKLTKKTCFLLKIVGMNIAFMGIDHHRRELKMQKTNFDKIIEEAYQNNPLAQKSIWNYKFILADHKITVTFGVN